MLKQLKNKITNMKATHEFFMMHNASFVTIALEGIKNVNFKVTLVPFFNGQTTYLLKENIKTHPENGWVAQIKLITGEGRKSLTSTVLNEIILPEKPTTGDIEEIVKNKYGFLLKKHKLKRRDYKRDLSSIFNMEPKQIPKWKGTSTQ